MKKHDKIGKIGCDRKTVYRLFEDLDELGIPYTVDREWSD